MKTRKRKYLGREIRTARGFRIVRFLDRSDTPCSLQASSLADYVQPGVSAIWIGPEEASPKVLASQASRFGVKTEQTTGWVPYPVPGAVLMSTRAHLDRNQVEALIRHLQTWLKTGSFV